ncbi:Retinol dehydrogenase 13 [Trichoplax sp. H2]|uniref:Retinol dehydrogenase 13 n=1 Tax=Trichoplax adhaerens TaxID=10228 RepID=B3RZ14_TRIAD|nr:hypothetical protein TRIADDRAFT_26230 [Trichoplax adhaerens]EDV23764.1 hypothetical protein TRIADDRAFT_26230 [Trichoplax adhaerens]RDD37270.1 Retinol dehydrogenase 13 [Trichoplax sp. H2]|eukprot:XP_002113290.1 hypothetical protein TRIADDRAFT_26230 [Trichoplax adhaerens]
MLKTAIIVSVIGIGLYYFFIPFATGSCEYYGKERLDGKTVIVTGANTGIGKTAAADLAQRGARVICACRSMERCNAAVADIKRETNNVQVVAAKLDLGSMKSIREFAQMFKNTEKRLDILINNAGIGCRNVDKKTEDGFEDRMGVNHLGHFLLTNLLLDMLKQSQPSRIVCLTSLIHWTTTDLDFDNLANHTSTSSCDNYSRSKIANILFVLELSKRLKGTGVTANAVHPGLVQTETLRSARESEGFLATSYTKFMEVVFLLVGNDARRGAQTTVYAAVDPSLENVSGQFLARCKIDTPSPYARDEAVAKKLYDMSLKLVNL